MGYNSWGHKESDMTERLHFHFYSPGEWANGRQGVGLREPGLGLGCHLAAQCGAAVGREGPGYRGASLKMVAAGTRAALSLGWG